MLHRIVIMLMLNPTSSRSSALRDNIRTSPFMPASSFWNQGSARLRCFPESFGSIARTASTAAFAEVRKTFPHRFIHLRPRFLFTARLELPVIRVFLTFRSLRIMPASMHIRRRVPVRCSLFFLLSSELAFSPWDCRRGFRSAAFLTVVSFADTFCNIGFRRFLSALFVYSACSSLPLHRSPPRRSPTCSPFPSRYFRIATAISYARFTGTALPIILYAVFVSSYRNWNSSGNPCTAPLPDRHATVKVFFFPRRTDTHYSRVSPFSAPADGADTVCRTPAR